MTALASRQYRENPAGLALTGNVIDADAPGPSTSLAHGLVRLSLSSSPHHRAVTRTHGGAPRSCHSKPSTVRDTWPLSSVPRPAPGGRSNPLTRVSSFLSIGAAVV